ncbi:MAG: ATP-binding protein [Deltaproteobacteria bacterium]|jgi:MinD superfamily P-loop ATPase|nr:ATP-binding protein [Deltaproteobacteria bacterium]MCW8892902.1 ATP-binding protein [Deltaproteobacteria bacterium]
MKQIAILSGKGGAGKTSVTASIIKLMDSVVAVDADVNASNLPILLPHFPRSTTAYYGMDIASIDHQLCTGCGACITVCQFDAITQNDGGRISIDSDCEGCAACAFTCPVDAINMVERKGGDWYVSTINNGYLVHADLIPGEDNSGKLITKVRNEASTVAKEHDISYIVIDGPPGTSCQAISSITGTDLVLAVVEESLSGLSDYRRLAELIQKFSIPHFVLINKAGFSQEVEDKIVAAAQEFEGTILGQIPFDHKIPQALQDLQSIADIDEYRDIIARVLTELQTTLTH